MSDDQFTQKLSALEARLKDIVQFLKRTTIQHQKSAIKLSKLPWYLFIGLEGAGKTTLLLHSNVPFVLQKRMPITNLPSDNIDFWVTREACIIDVPSQYLTLRGERIDPRIWQYFLHHLKKERGKNALAGVILATACPILSREEELQQAKTEWQQLLAFMHELQDAFTHPIPCRVVLTKCDLLPGFTEFFSEYTEDEAMQAWGLSLSTLSDAHAETLIVQKFDALIKKLNQQLLSRLHHERDPFAKLIIKDFPLQLERLKNMMVHFVKQYLKLNAQSPLKGIYLTSAKQLEKAPTATTETLADTTAIQRYQAPVTSRAYFAKQLILHHLTDAPTPTQPLIAWRPLLLYSAIGGTLLTMSLLLYKNFITAAETTTLLGAALSQYEEQIQQTTDPKQAILTTIAFLNQVRPETNNFFMNPTKILSFYTHRIHSESRALYQQTLKNIFIPEIKEYLATYLQASDTHAINANYNALKAYAMLQVGTTFDAAYLSKTLGQLLDLKTEMVQPLTADLTAAKRAGIVPTTIDTTLLTAAQDRLSMQLFQTAIHRLRHLSHPTDLFETDEMIGELINPKTPFMQAMKTLYEDPTLMPFKTTTSSTASRLVDQITLQLQLLHQLLYTVLQAPDKQKTAGELTALYNSEHPPESILQLRLLAKQSPLPVKIWLNHVGDAAWYYLPKQETTKRAPL